MEKLVARIAEATGMPPETSERIAGIVLVFLAREAPGPAVARLIAAIPGGQSAVDIAAAEPAVAATPPGMGLMGLAGELSAAGLSMAEMTSLAAAFFGYAAEATDEDTVGSIVGAVPGLEQYM